MIVLQVSLGNVPRGVCLDPHCVYKYLFPRLRVELPNDNITPVYSTHAVTRFFLRQCVEKSVAEICVQFKLHVVSFCTLTWGTPRLLAPMAQSLDLLHAARLHTDFEI